MKLKHSEVQDEYDRADLGQRNGTLPFSVQIRSVSRPLPCPQLADTSVEVSNKTPVTLFASDEDTGWLGGGGRYTLCRIPFAPLNLYHLHVLLTPSNQLIKFK